MLFNSWAFVLLVACVVFGFSLLGIFAVGFFILIFFDFFFGFGLGLGIGLLAFGGIVISPQALPIHYASPHGSISYFCKW